MTLGEAVQQNPLIDVPVAGDKIVYDNLEVSFLVDEDLYAWTTIVDWMKGLGFPETSDQYKNLPLQQRIQLGATAANGGQYSDAMITVYTNKNNPILQVKFVDLFPINIGSLNFSTAESAEAIMTATVTFRFMNYSILRF